MGLGPKLDHMLDRIGLSPAEIDQRLRYLHWQPADEQRLQQAAAERGDSHLRFIDQLYAHLGQFPPLAAILSEPATLQRLKRSQA
ncbi:protoglobin domain-containing protein, partial [Pseudomonas aeruginosa]